jgi:anti-sigma B factor antagonist
LVSLDGRLDQTAAHEVRTVLLPLLGQRDRVLLDLTGVHSATEAGLRAMLLLYRYAKRAGARMALVGVPGDIRDVLDAAGFLRFFMLAPDRATALAALGDRVLQGQP